MTASEDDIRAFIAKFFADGAVSGISIDSILVNDDFDVLVDGQLDSLGFLELLTQLETEFGRELDLSEAHERDVTRVRTLVKAAAGS